MGFGTIIIISPKSEEGMYERKMKFVLPSELIRSFFLFVSFLA